MFHLDTPKEDLKDKPISNDIEIINEESLKNQEDIKKSSKIQVVSTHPNDPLEKDLREFAFKDAFDGRAPYKHQNPLLNLLNPKDKDYSEDIFSVPEYRQDPLLRLLKQNPENFQEDFLELPPKQQNGLLKMLMKGGKQFDINQLIPPSFKQNPLLRILVNNDQDEKDKNNLTPPRFQSLVFQSINKTHCSDKLKSIQKTTKMTS